ncbi:MAG TPA: hypothetical protein VM537_13450, partial [Anaerolineae bacterium]|nr:hypothetical protein [Anaerolineae bacterium]
GAAGWAAARFSSLEQGAWTLLLGGAVLAIVYGLLTWPTQPDLRRQITILLTRLLSRVRSRQGQPSG